MSSSISPPRSTNSGRFRAFRSFRRTDKSGSFTSAGAQQTGFAGFRPAGISGTGFSFGTGLSLGAIRLLLWFRVSVLGRRSLHSWETRAQAALPSRLHLHNGRAGGAIRVPVAIHHSASAFVISGDPKKSANVCTFSRPSPSKRDHS